MQCTWVQELLHVHGHVTYFVDQFILHKTSSSHCDLFISDIEIEHEQVCWGVVMFKDNCSAADADSQSCMADMLYVIVQCNM